MDAKQLAEKCRQMMAGESAEDSEAAGTREPCGQMAAMCGGGDAAEMLQRCGQMAAQFAGQGQTAEEPEQSEPEGPQVA